MFAIVRYTVQHDGAVRDYEVKKIFELSATHEACEEYLLKNKPRKNWSVSSGGALYRNDTATDTTDWMLIVELPDPTPLSTPLFPYV